MKMVKITSLSGLYKSVHNELLLLHENKSLQDGNYFHQVNFLREPDTEDCV